ncbi:X-linked interleukin-1 receptor accessory protein-like 2 isoform X2 [Clavelina lepadiformis]|uniref:Soluble interferon alpha/beta receptor OPG204 n=1 Tax=Clavelina lepadiformis TaxID=159417 RepID=A0ABP0FWC8_CLALP
MKRLFIKTYLYVIGVFFLSFSNSVTGLPCTVQDAENVTVYIGWPHEVSCYDLLFDIIDDVDEVESDYEINFKIWNSDNGQLLKNETTSYEDYYYQLVEFGSLLVDIKSGENYNYDIQIHIPSQSKCYTKNVHLKPISFQQITCEMYITRNANMRFAAAEIGTTKQFSCKGLVSVDSLQNATVTWQRNCSSLPSQGVTVKHNTLNIESVGYEHAGIYTCSVRYRGMTDYILYNRVCVVPRPSTSQHKVTCEKNVYDVTDNQVLTVKCALRLGIGKASASDFNVDWSKAEGVGKKEWRLCSKPNELSSPNRNGIICTFEQFSQNSDTCFLHVATEKEKEIRNDIRNIIIFFKNVSASDYGVYELKATSNTETVSDFIASFSLRRNKIAGLLSTAHITVVVIGILAFLTLLLSFCVWKSLEIRVYYKRYFAACAQDDKLYGAVLSYYYSNELDKFAKEDVGKYVQTTGHVLTELGYKIYDDHKDGLAEVRLESFQRCIDASHRVIIILTSTYIKDDWNRRNLQQALQSVIESRTRIILIFSEGVREYVNQHSKSDDTCRLIKETARLNYIIVWSKRKKFEAKMFRLMLEDAMPKLSSQKQLRPTNAKANHRTRNNQQKFGVSSTISKNCRHDAGLTTVETDSTMVEAGTDPFSP